MPMRQDSYAYAPEHPPYSPVNYEHPPYTSQPQRRPISDPNDVNFSSLRLTEAQPHARATTTVEQIYDQYGEAGDTVQPLRDGAASVYSLDSGMGAYTQQPYGWDRQEYQNPYYAAANDFLGMPPQGPPSNGPPASQYPSQTTLSRTNTSASALSNTSSLSRSVTNGNSIGSSNARRKGTQAAIDVNKPPYTKAFVDEYRTRMKGDPDPEAQFGFAKYLIEAAKILGDEVSKRDARSGRKYRDMLVAESLKLVKKLATGTDAYADAQFFLANLYGTGQLGLQVDHERAYQLYMQASKQNHPAATYRTAVCNEIGAGTRKEPNRATLFYRKAAALGDTAAMYKLGMILLGGLLSQPRNPREAITWLRRAANQADEDNPHALHELALLHERQDPKNVVMYDPAAAKELFTQAAQLGYPPAQFKLGSCYEYGSLGCPVDPRRSIAWYTRAAEKGDSEAELSLSGWYLTGSGESQRRTRLMAEGVLKQSDTEAYLWGRKAANKGLAKAEYAVGCKWRIRSRLTIDYTEIGIGVKQDMELAKRWYMRAAGMSTSFALAKSSATQQARNAAPDRNEEARREQSRGQTDQTAGREGMCHHVARCIYNHVVNVIIGSLRLLLARSPEANRVHTLH